jgi:hypothetical protein
VTAPTFSVDSWSDLADIATILSLPVIVAAVIMTGRQITSQFTASRREASFEVFLRFTEKFSDVIERQAELAERFEAKDRTLNQKAVTSFYVQYWILQINYWEMFRAGLLPVAIYGAWLNYTHDSIAGETSLGYFDTRGKPQAMSSEAAFEHIFLKRMLRGQPDCAAFFRELAAIPHGWSPEAGFAIQDEPGRAGRHAAIITLLTKRQKAYRARPVWKID